MADKTGGNTNKKCKANPALHRGSTDCWPWGDLEGYGLTNLGDGLYIAPDWWIVL